MIEYDWHSEEIWRAMLPPRRNARTVTSWLRGNRRLPALRNRSSAAEPFIYREAQRELRLRRTMRKARRGWA